MINVVKFTPASGGVWNPASQSKEGAMRITTRGRYALRASLALAKMEKDNGGPVSINHLAEIENISPVFLEQIFFKLRKAGIVSSSRGPGGGFCFSRNLDTLTVKEILDSAGEEIELTLCDKREDNCDRIGECISHYVISDAHDLLKKYFSEITIASILEKYGPKSRYQVQEQNP